MTIKIMGTMGFPLWCSGVSMLGGLTQWAKDPALLQLQLGLQLWLGSHPWPGISICHRAAKKKKKNNTGNSNGITRSERRLDSHLK